MREEKRKGVTTQHWHQQCDDLAPDQDRVEMPQASPERSQGISPKEHSVTHSLGDEVQGSSIPGSNMIWKARLQGFLLCKISQSLVR